MNALPTAEEQLALLDAEAGKTPLDRLQEMMASAFNHVDSHALRAGLVTVLTSPIRDTPLWVFVVGPPSNLKSEMLRWPTGDTVYRLSSLTAHTLISGFGKNPEYDLLSKLDGKVLVLKDFTSILSMDRNARNEIFAQLRESYDGSYAKDFGNVGHKSYRAFFHLLAASTSALEDYYTPQSFLGQRFLIVRSPETDSFETARQGFGNEEDIREEFRTHVRETLADAEIGRWREVDTQPIRELRPLIELLAKARAYVPRSSGGKVKSYPEPEDPARLTKQATKLTVGHALLMGRMEIGEADLSFTARVLVESIPRLRYHVLRRFLMGPWPLDELAVQMGLPRSTMDRTLWDLKLLGLVNRDDTELPYIWRPRKGVEDAFATLSP